MEKAKILFDGNCIVCDTEVLYYKRKAPHAFDIVDISHPDFDAKSYGLTKEAVDFELHLIAPDGKLHKGVEAFAYIWDNTPGYSYLGKVVRLPLINGSAQIGYWIFARLRRYLPKRKKDLKT